MYAEGGKFILKERKSVLSRLIQRPAPVTSNSMEYPQIPPILCLLLDNAI
jgi:hypothetical protein